MSIIEEVFCPGNRIELSFVIKPDGYTKINSSVKCYEQNLLTLLVNGFELQESIPLGSEITLTCQNKISQNPLQFVSYVLEHRSMNLSQLLLAQPVEAKSP